VRLWKKEYARTGSADADLSFLVVLPRLKPLTREATIKITKPPSEAEP
jgi:hypothetical protein